MTYGAERISTGTEVSSCVPSAPCVTGATADSTKSNSHRRLDRLVSEATARPMAAPGRNTIGQPESSSAGPNARLVEGLRPQTHVDAARRSDSDGGSIPPGSILSSYTAADLSALRTRLRARSTLDAGCILWTGASRAGYGAIKVRGVLAATHRLSYEIEYGPIPDGMSVCHRCDRPSCINPEHLFVGTRADNMADGYAKGRVCPPSRLENLLPGGFNRSLSEAEASSLRSDIASRGSETLRSIAERWSLPLHLVKDVSSGRTYPPGSTTFKSETRRVNTGFQVTPTLE